MKLISLNPSKKYEVIGEVESSSEVDVSRAVEAAKVAQIAWSKLLLKSRCDAVQSFMEVARKRSEEIAHLIALETGRPVTGARQDVAKGLDCFVGYLESAEQHLSPKTTYETDTEIHRVYREPWGVIGAICPWNFPFTNVAWQCGQALIAGNAVVYKNSDENPFFAKIIEEIVTESTLPKSVFSVLYGDRQVGEWLARSDVNRISFTGSFTVGSKLTQIAAEKFIPITTELGGSNPYVVFEGVELSDELVQGIYNKRFLHSGQFCTSVKRLIAHESLFDELVTKLAEVATTKKIGDACDESTDIGPLVAERQLSKLEDQVADSVSKGAKIITGGKRPEGLEGAYYEPTILTNITKDMRVWREETFGPVLPVISFKTETEAIILANDTEYGLSAYISTNNKDQFARVAKSIKAGMIAENQILNLVAKYNPFGGYKHSGMGRENGSYGYDECTQTKLVSEAK